MRMAMAALPFAPAVAMGQTSLPLAPTGGGAQTTLVIPPAASAQDLASLLSATALWSDLGTKTPTLVSWKKDEKISFDDTKRTLTLTLPNGEIRTTTYAHNAKIYGLTPEGKQIPISIAAKATAGVDSSSTSTAEPTTHPAGGGQHHVTVSPDDTAVTIQYPNGATVTKTLTEDGKGSRAWRNNNPGNILRKDYQLVCGAIGVDSEGHMIFASEEDGWKAMIELLKKPSYQNLTVRDAISLWVTGKSKNPTPALGQIQKIGSISNAETCTIVSELSPERFQNLYRSMSQNEGWIRGKLLVTGKPPIELDGPPDFDDLDGSDGEHHDHKQEHDKSHDGTGAEGLGGALAAAAKWLCSGKTSTYLVGAGVAGTMLYMANKEAPEKDVMDTEPLPTHLGPNTTRTLTAPMTTTTMLATRPSPSAASDATPTHAATNNVQPQAASFRSRLNPTKETTPLPIDKETAAKDTKWFTPKNLAIVAATAGVGIVTYMATRGTGRGR